MGGPFCRVCGNGLEGTACVCPNGHSQYDSGATETISPFELERSMGGRWVSSEELDALRARVEELEGMLREIAQMNWSDVPRVLAKARKSLLAKEVKP